MIPVLYKFVFDTPLAQGLLYLVAVGLVGYLALAGWRGAVGPQGRKSGEPLPPSQRDRIDRAVRFGVGGLALALLGLWYALPPSAFVRLPVLGAPKGEGIPIHTYGVLLATGFISAVTLAAHLAVREWRGEEGERKREQILDLAFWVLVAGIAGAHLLFILVNIKDYLADPRRFLQIGGGMVFYGGLIGAVLASYVYARKNDIDFLRLADLAMPAVSLGQAFGRLGCFSAGCCWGDVTRAAMRFSVKFPGGGLVRNLFGQPADTPSLAYQTQVTDSRWVLESTGEIFHQAVPGAVKMSSWVAEHGHTLPVHPTQLYESVGQFFLFLALLSLRRYRRFHGQIFALWLMAYAVLRTTVELFRGDVERGTLNGLLNSLGMTSLAQKVPLEAWYNISTSQFISLCLFTLGATVLYRRGRQLWSGAPQAKSAPASA